MVDKRVNRQIAQFEYCIKWQGYCDEDNTWEPVESLPGCEETLEEFEDELDAKSIKRLGKELSEAKEVCCFVW